MNKDLVDIAKDHSDKGYTLSTHQKQAEFAAKRNYFINEDGLPIDATTGELVSTIILTEEK